MKEHYILLAVFIFILIMNIIGMIKKSQYDKSLVLEENAKIIGFTTHSVGNQYHPTARIYVKFSDGYIYEVVKKEKDGVGIVLSSLTTYKIVLNNDLKNKVIEEAIKAHQDEYNNRKRG